MSEQTSERSGGRERSEQSGASEQVSGASERTNGRASGSVLTSRFLFVPDHCAVPLYLLLDSEMVQFHFLNANLSKLYPEITFSRISTVFDRKKVRTDAPTNPDATSREQIEIRKGKKRKEKKRKEKKRKANGKERETNCDS